jgi:hypothetical protein
MPGLLLAGFLMGAISSLPVVGVLCCLWALAGGAAAVGLYRWRGRQTVTTGMGARLGAAAGLVGFLPFSLVFVGRMLFKGRELREALRKGMEQAVASNPDTKTAAEVAQWFATPEGTALLITLVLVLFLLAFLIFATVGGAIGAALFGQKDSGSSSEST